MKFADPQDMTVYQQQPQNEA